MSALRVGHVFVFESHSFIAILSFENILDAIGFKFDRLNEASDRILNKEMSLALTRSPDWKNGRNQRQQNKDGAKNQGEGEDKRSGKKSKPSKQKKKSKKDEPDKGKKTSKQ